MELHVRIQFDDERLVPLIYRALDLFKPQGLTAAVEADVYRRLVKAVERAEAAAK